jgi:RNA polymerase sigma-70 factor (ECF subfamily)
MAHEHLSDVDLFRGWCDGDREMGKVFYQRMAPKILAYFRRNVYDRSKVEELTHDTFVEALHSTAKAAERGTAKEVGNPRAYLFGIAAHVFSRHIRQRRKELGRPESQPEDSEDSLHSLDPLADPEYLRLQRDEDRLFMKAMRKLPFNQQIVLELSFWENMSGSEIAETLKLAEGTVRSRIRLGRDRLAKLIEQLQESPEQFRTATLSFTSWKKQIHEYMSAIDPEWDKDGERG